MKRTNKTSTTKGTKRKNLPKNHKHHCHNHHHHNHHHYASHKKTIKTIIGFRFCFSLIKVTRKSNRQAKTKAMKRIRTQAWTKITKKTNTWPKYIKLNEQLTFRLSFEAWAFKANKTQKPKTLKMQHKNLEAWTLNAKITWRKQKAQKRLSSSLSPTPKLLCPRIGTRIQCI